MTYWLSSKLYLMNNMKLHKVLRFNHLMEKVLAKKLKNDEAQEYLMLMKQWNEEFKNKHADN